jgi:hypothetical protein
LFIGEKGFHALRTLVALLAVATPLGRQGIMLFRHY